MFLLRALLLFFTTNYSVIAQAPSFGPREDKGLIEFNQIDEASGIAASKKNQNVLWLHNDSGDSARIFAINQNGKHLGVFSLTGVANRDWEDISVGPGPNPAKDYLYIAEIGDNLAQYDMKYIYRISEPQVNAYQQPVYVTLGNPDIIKFKYPDGPRDAEALFIDPLTKDIYIISKRENNVRVYLLSYPQSLKDTLTPEFITELPVTQIVAGDISFDGREILLKDYDNIYYWKREINQSVAEAFIQNQFYNLPYIREPQGEGICWSFNADGYYTVSEEPLNIPAHLYFYPKVSTNSLGENEEQGYDFKLEQNYPNPFNPSTSITYTIANKEFVSLKVFNVLGQEVSDLLNEEKLPGRYKILFNGKNLPNGIYFYKLQTFEQTETKSMTLLK